MPMLMLMASARRPPYVRPSARGHVVAARKSEALLSASADPRFEASVASSGHRAHNAHPIVNRDRLDRFRINWPNIQLAESHTMFNNIACLSVTYCIY